MALSSRIALPIKTASSSLWTIPASSTTSTAAPYQSICRQCRARQSTQHISWQRRSYAIRQGPRTVTAGRVDADSEPTTTGAIIGNETTMDPAPPTAPSRPQTLSEIVAQYMSPTDSLSSILDPDSKESLKNIPPLTLDKPPMKLGPVAGRTVRVDQRGGGDVARAFAQLSRVCSTNRVQQEFMQQRFHERAGLKRKRLRKQRWRMQFKAGFFAMLQRSREMKQMGW